VLKQRVITAVVLVGALLAALAWSPFAFALLLTLAFAVAQAEWLQLTGWRFSAALAVALALGALLIAALMNAPSAVAAATAPLAAVATVVWLVIGVVLIRSEQVGRPVRIHPTVSVGLAVLLPLAAWFALMLFLRDGAVTLLSVLMIVWLADTAAYFSGRALGRRKLAPHISPGKTWAGAWGGMIAVVVVAFIVWSAFPAAPVYTNHLLDAFGPGQTIPVLAFLVAVSIIGDLFESLLKRQAGQKDSGHLLPGHGGFFDRLDAMLSLLPPAALFWDWAH
jgi:phosphatidate cytidylyltransferase